MLMESYISWHGKTEFHLVTYFRCVFADIGVIFGRYFKHYNPYLNIHTICFILTDLITIVMYIIQRALGEGSKDPIFLPHKVLSLILLSYLIIF